MVLWLLLRTQLVILVYFSSHYPASARHTEECQKPLGMESGEIPDHFLSSSTNHSKSTIPRFARLGRDEGGGAWCPFGTITRSSREYLQVRLEKPKVITAVATQGRYAEGRGKEFVEEYKVLYWRPSLRGWRTFKNKEGHEILRGNNDTFRVVPRELFPAVIATAIRFMPYARSQRHACMRVELYGCDYTGGLLSYSTPQGSKAGVSLDDKTYDGEVNGNYLSGGLGQLVDGYFGEGEPLWSSDGLRLVYNWIGWYSSHHPNGVEITFEFDHEKNIHGIEITFNNIHSKRGRVFESVVIRCSLDNTTYKDTEEFTQHEQQVLDKAQVLLVPVQCQAKFLKVKLEAASDLMLISEITFPSGPLDFKPEVTTQKPVVTKQTAGATTQNHIHYEVSPKTLTTGSRNLTSLFHPEKMSTTKHIAVLTRPTTTSKVDDDSGDDEEYNAAKDDNLAIVIAVGISVPILAIIIFLLVGYYCLKQSNNKKKAPRRHVLYLPANRLSHPLTGADIIRVNEYDGEPSAPPVQSLCDCKTSLPPKKARNLPEDRYDDNDSAVEKEQPSSPLYYELEPIYDHLLPPVKVVPETHEPVYAYAAADIVLGFTAIQGVSGNNVYAVTDQKRLSEEGAPPPEIPRDKLKFIRRLGGGSFGEVNLCEARDILHRVPKRMSKCTVAVKTLRESASQKLVFEFNRETRILSCLDHPNVSKVIGVCTSPGPHCMVVEYTELGDLQHFLMERTFEESSTFKATNHLRSLRFQDLLFLSIQVSSGMEYLENRGFIHRDLASRSCLVGRGLTIKISDLAMSRLEDFPAEYYQVQGRSPLPIRWMPWESLFLGKFSCKSDVWSFGVTVWEILTLRENLPYSELEDNDFINCFQQDKLPVLSQPNCCPANIYELLKKCLKRDESARPTFRGIHRELDKELLNQDFTLPPR